MSIILLIPQSLTDLPRCCRFCNIGLKRSIYVKHDMFFSCENCSYTICGSNEYVPISRDNNNIFNSSMYLFNNYISNKSGVVTGNYDYFSDKTHSDLIAEFDFVIKCNSIFQTVVKVKSYMLLL